MCERLLKLSCDVGRGQFLSKQKQESGTVFTSLLEDAKGDWPLTLALRNGHTRCADTLLSAAIEDCVLASVHLLRQSATNVCFLALSQNKCVCDQGPLSP